jgi:glucosamine--fructose-6-phosphate aminotransferase (isomerizing)
MCGIVGYIGAKNTVEVLLDGLKRLEYRGYDSAGIAFVHRDGLKVTKAKGRLRTLDQMMCDVVATDTVGIGHTRWATHGEPSDINSHPHTDVSGNIAVVHNGIIENYLKLKNMLIEEGVTFVSETDTEVAAHLINRFYEGDLLLAVQKAVNLLEGSYALGVVSDKHPELFVCVKKDSPLVIGLGKDENFIASDIPAILKYTRDIYLLEDGEVAVLKRDGVQVYDELGNPVKKEIFKVEWDIAQAEKGGYEHFMLKEMHEEPRALTDTLMPRIKDGRIDLAEAGIDEAFVSGINKLFIVACGTAYHAGFMGKYLIEKLARMPVEVDIASEFRYRDPLITEGDVMLVISQSGETADTIAAIREAKKRGAKVLAVVNAVGSTISREADAVIYTRAGPEIAVASTKAYNTQLMAVYMIALEFARIKGTLAQEEYSVYLKGLVEICGAAKAVLDQKKKLQKLASRHFNQKSVFYIGRSLDYLLAMEGSLKLKEISYIHSEAYAAGELKHGTIALIEPGTLVVAVLTQDALFDKTVSNIKEVKARGAYVLAIAAGKHGDLADFADEVIELPDCESLLLPIIAVTPMQLFAYYMAVEKGCDVDKPRNLAKSVTVE